MLTTGVVSTTDVVCALGDGLMVYRPPTAALPVEWHTREMKIGFYRYGLRLLFVCGRLAEIAPWQAEDAAGFPNLALRQRLSGCRSLAELMAAFRNGWMNAPEMPKRPEALLPKRDSSYGEIM